MAIAMLQINPEKAKAFFEQEMAFTTGPVELSRMLDNPDITVVDVREAEDYAKGHIPGAVNLPANEWATLKGLEKDKTNILYCYSMVCHLAKKAAVEFASKGYPVMEMNGGFAAWQENELPVDD